jgi:Leucine-rich repeat (LRR) protein
MSKSNYLEKIEISYDIDICNKLFSEIPILYNKIWKSDKLNNIIYLKLSYNNLQNIPNTINKLINLKKLYLNNNNLTQIPYTINKLINLYILDLSFNKLKYIPYTISNLVKLKFLYLHNNIFRTIPSIVNNLNLNPISFCKNKIMFIKNIKCTDKILFSYDSYSKNICYKNKIIIIPFLYKYYKFIYNIKKPYNCCLFFK